MPIDREAVLRTAERLLRQGKLDAAIAEYVRLTEDQPKDWNSINTLGDLYVRAGHTDRAVAQFLRIADHLFAEGFLPKAAALYKKALKVKQDHEHTLIRLSEIAVRQELFADAKLYLRQLTLQRQNRGDHRGAAECVLRLGAIDEDDAEAKVAAAKAAQSIDDAPQAATLWQEAAAAYQKQHRHAEATDALMAAAELRPEDGALRAHVAKALVAAGQLERAQPFLAAASAGDDADLLLAIARRDLMSGSSTAPASLMRAIALAPDQQGQVLAMVDELAAAGRVEDAYACLEVVVDAALFEAAFDRATKLLDAFLSLHRVVPGLLKLVDIYVDAGLDDRITAVQEQLADAYLECGQPAEARVVAEDLVARGPEVEANVQRLRRALTALGVDDVEAIVAQQLEVAPLFSDDIELTSFEATDDVAVLVESHAIAAADLPAEEPILEVERLPSPAMEEASREDDDAVPPVVPNFEIDLSGVLADLNGTAGASRRTPAAAIDNREQDPAEMMLHAQELVRRGATREASTTLQAVARIPQFRFKAAAQLGRLALADGDIKGGIEWLERAASAPAEVADDSFAVLYDLADALERSGEQVRALAVFMELESDAGPYRDVRTRIDLLTGSTGLTGDRA